MTPLSRVIELVLRGARGLASRWRNIYCRARGMTLTGYVLMRAIRVPEDPHAITIEKGVALHEGVVLLSVASGGRRGRRGRIFIGANTSVNRNTFIDASASITIGRWVAIGPGCYITDHDHGTAAGGTPILLQPLASAPTTIGDDVWLGAHTKVLKGVTIGNGAIIGAGSVVSRDIPANVVAVGAPARIVRTRQ